MILVLFIAFVVVGLWLVLVASGALSILWSRRSPKTASAARLALAVVPIGFGVVMFQTRPEFTFNQVHFSLGWIFIIPMLLGVAAILFWILARQQNGNPA